MFVPPKNKTALLRTSTTDPLQIDSMPISDTGALLGITMRPGRIMRSMTGGDWNRSIDEDMAAIRNWAPHIVIELCDPKDSGIDISKTLAKAQREFSEFTLYRRFFCQDGAFLPSWERISFLQICDWMRIGLKDDRDPARVLVISERGLLRAGLAAAHILHFNGYPESHIPALLETLRPGSFETERQHQLFQESLKQIHKGKQI